MRTNHWDWKEIAPLAASLLLIPVVVISMQPPTSPIASFIFGIAVGLSIAASFVTLASRTWEPGSR